MWLGYSAGWGLDPHNPIFSLPVTAIVPTGASYFVYDEAGKVLGEYDASGVPIYETVYLGSTPAGVIKQTGTAAGSNIAVALYNVSTDHLGAPRVITRQSDNAIVWRWDSAESYGGSVPDQNPNGLGAFVYNARFPGQTFDAETGLFQNWMREYNPRIGRYMESDPLGLGGGINTYEYVGGNPISLVDPNGLQLVEMGQAAAAMSSGLAAAIGHARPDRNPDYTPPGGWRNKGGVYGVPDPLIWGNSRINTWTEKDAKNVENCGVTVLGFSNDGYEAYAQFHGYNHLSAQVHFPGGYEATLARLGRDGIWETINKPFLQAAIDRGDKFIFTTPVAEILNLFMRRNELYTSRNKPYPFTVKEIEMLTNNGYVPYFDTNTMGKSFGKAGASWGCSN